jgi:Tol biopolymer transport system component
LRSGVAFTVLLLAVGCGGGDEAARTASRSTVESIAFASSRDGDFEIYTMRPDGTGVRQLTENEETGEAERRDEGPKWSPDGHWIAFTSGRDHGRGGVEIYELYVMRADGTGERRLTDNDVADLLVGWTENGEIVFWRCSEGVAGCKLAVIDRDGGDERTVYETEDAVVALGWISGDEVYATIVDRDAESFDEAETFAIDIGNGDRRTVETSGLPSPDGTQLLILSDRDKNGRCLFHDCSGHALELYVDDRRLTRTTAMEADAHWSPGGKRILFGRIENDQGDDYELWVMNADGTCETQLTDNGDWDWTPDWYGRPEDDRTLTC